MKKTVNIDQTLLAEARTVTGAATDTEAVRLGLEELVRQGVYERLRALRSKPATAGTTRRRTKQTAVDAPRSRQKPARRRRSS